MSEKFKKGDKVRLITKYPDGDNRAFERGYLEIGGIYVVKCDSGYSYPLDLENSAGYSVSYEMVELVVENVPEKTSTLMGIVPREIHDSKRLEEIKTALSNYMNARLALPVEWIEEYNELCERA